jgi:hypothetical protein
LKSKGNGLLITSTGFYLNLMQKIPQSCKINLKTHRNKQERRYERDTIQIVAANAPAPSP